MLPEIEEYFEAANDYSAEYERRLNEVREANPVPRWSDRWDAEQRAAFYEADAKRVVAENEVAHYRRERKAIALVALKNHDDKMISWLMNNAVINRSYTGHRDEVLQALPMTREEIEAFGGNQGWCGEYDDFLNLAKDAGVLPEPKPMLADIEPLVRAIRTYYGGNARRFRQVVAEHLPALLDSYEAGKAERAEAEKEKAEKVASELRADVDKAIAETMVKNSERDSEPSDAVIVRTSDGRFAPARAAF